jgi:hypothetical protein
MTCLLVAHPVQGLREGIGDEGCSPEGLDTIAELEYDGNNKYGDSNGGVFAGLPTSGLIRFVLRDDHVDVYVYLRATDPIAPQG